MMTSTELRIWVSHVPLVAKGGNWLRLADQMSIHITKYKHIITRQLLITRNRQHCQQTRRSL
eukprot:scaffold31462_cov20-Prasinocladus_malaysianus.AAC.3